MFLSKLFSRNSHADRAHAIYAAAVARGREPVFFRDLAVPDTVEGRFEMIALHVYMILRRLKRGGAADGALGQALFDLMFADMDRNLRELGVGDLGVGRRVKTMAQAFYGRIDAYDQGLEAGEAALARALSRNVYAANNDATEVAVTLARYVAASVAALDVAPETALAQGEVCFAPLPEAPR